MVDPRNIFFVESRELLDSMESSLLMLEKDFKDEESINAVFRAAHTIKGNSGLFGLDIIGNFTHQLESILASIRNGSLKLDNKMIGIFLVSRDYLAALLNFYEDNADAGLSDELKDTYDVLLKSLSRYLPQTKKNGADALNNKEKGKSEIYQAHNKECWHISISFGRDVFRDGLDPESFIRYLGEKGDIKSIYTVLDDMPAEKDMDPESCYLGFEIDFKSNISKKDIEDIFEFVRDDSILKIIPPEGAVKEYVDRIQVLPEKKMLIGEMLKEVGSITETELENALEIQKQKNESEDSSDLIGNVMIDENITQKTVLDSALEKQQNIKKRDEKNNQFIRIDAEKLDRLINLIGELVITGSNVKQIANSEAKTGLVETVSVMSRLIEEIRDSTMNVRMVQIGETFNKYERIVRDLSRDHGKKIELTINGGDTELDKTLIDKISDPLTHLIRNAVDHGIDSPEKRKKLGKPEKGAIILNAYHETGNIIIEVRDDGNGLDRDNIKKKAIQTGLISATSEITDYELFQLIFEPGFSTAEKVTSTSGRGVGMDVVKRNIESLRGTVDLTSEKNKGTTVRLHLPLTLAIIDGFMVQIGNSYYVLPLDMVIECTEVRKEEIDAKGGGNFINLRGDVLPFMRLRNHFNEDGEEPEKPKVVIVEYARKKAGLVVDNLIGEFQTVIKPLGKIFSKLQWISGSTILGTGEVAYILDVPKLIQHIKINESKELRMYEMADVH